MAEKNILAHFNSPEQAELALEQMRGLNIIDSAIRRANKYSGEGVDHIQNPITGNIPSLGYLTLGGNFDRDEGVLAAASTSASGMSSGGDDNEVSGKDIMLIVVVDEQDYEQAMEIAKNAGGLV